MSPCTQTEKVDKIWNLSTAWKGPYSKFFWSVFSYEVFLVRIFLRLGRMRKDTLYQFLFSLNARKYGPEKLRIETLFTHWKRNNNARMNIPVKDFVCKWQKKQKTKKKQKQSLKDILYNRDFSTGGFLVKFANFLGSPFFTEYPGWLFLKKIAENWRFVHIYWGDL